VQVPEYLKKQGSLKAAGIDEVIVYCVNDGAVMDGWAKDQMVEDSMITFLADPRSELTQVRHRQVQEEAAEARASHQSV
jgi:2-Cys peroxiredoxin 5